ncbi:MAG: hypothetical protein DME38_14365 [Verrucomicrobia bacterium]|nr:MAG: hypothetical protein DME38_14365 [Verrucomicrobiota bacterium]
MPSLPPRIIFFYPALFGIHRGCFRLHFIKSKSERDILAVSGCTAVRRTWARDGAAGICGVANRAMPDLACQVGIQRLPNLSACLSSYFCAVHG